MKAYWNLTPQEQVTRSMKCAVASALLAILFGVLGIINIYQEKNVTERCTATTTGYVVSVFFNAGMGGITPRLNPDGSLCVVDVDKESDMNAETD